VGEAIQWDGSLEALHRIQREIPDCLLDYQPGEGILHVRTERNPETGVPYGWWVTRVRDGIAVISREREINA
jgi:hypothetical protein